MKCIVRKIQRSFEDITDTWRHKRATSLQEEWTDTIRTRNWIVRNSLYCLPYQLLSNFNLGQFLVTSMQESKVQGGQVGGGSREHRLVLVRQYCCHVSLLTSDRSILSFEWTHVRSSLRLSPSVVIKFLKVCGYSTNNSILSFFQEITLILTNFWFNYNNCMLYYQKEDFWLIANI